MKVYALILISCISSNLKSLSYIKVNMLKYYIRIIIALKGD